MTIAGTQGRVGELAVSVAGSSYTDAGGLTDMSWSNSRGTIDTSNFDGGGWEENIPGLGSFTVSGTCVYDEDDAGQIILPANNTAGTQLYYRWRPRGTLTTYKQVIFQGTLTSFEVSQAVDGKVELSFETQGTAAPAVTAQ